MSSSTWKSPCVRTSSPARSWSLMTVAYASCSFSRKRTSCMQVSSGLPHMLTSNQRGRGNEPVVVLGRIRSFVAVNMALPPVEIVFQPSLQRQPHCAKIQSESSRLHVQILSGIGKDPFALIRTFRHHVRGSERQALSINLE